MNKACKLNIRGTQFSIFGGHHGDGLLIYVMNSDHYRKMYITSYPQISSFVAVNNYQSDNYQSDNFHHKTNTPLVALGEWPTELKDR